MSDATPSTDTLTVVLVHGAFADASGWNGVVERPLTKGSHVIMISKPVAVTDVIMTAAAAVDRPTIATGGGM